MSDPETKYKLESNDLATPIVFKEPVLLKYNSQYLKCQRRVMQNERPNKARH